MSQKKKKTNPRRLPVSMADVMKAKDEAMAEAIQAAYAIIFTVLRDKHDYTVEQLNELWHEINDLSDSLAKGYVKVKDLLWVLKEEAGIKIVDKE